MLNMITNPTLLETRFRDKIIKHSFKIKNNNIMQTHI